MKKLKLIFTLIMGLALMLMLYGCSDSDCNNAGTGGTLLPPGSLNNRSISGIVQNGLTPVDGAVVVLYTDGAEVARTTTGADGTFSFTALRPADYMVIATSNLGTINQNTSTLTQNVTGLVLDYNNPGVRGTISGFIKDANNVPVPQATVELYPTKSAVKTIELLHSTITDNQGYYQFDNIPEGIYTVNIIVNGITIGEHTATVNSDGSSPQVNITVPVTPDPVNPDPPATKGSIYGDVTFSGMPVEGATLTLYSITSSEDPGTQIGQQTSDAQGKYTFADLNPGSYRLITEHTSYTAMPTEITISEESLNIELPITMEQNNITPGALTGTVSTTEGLLIQNAIVHITSLDNPDDSYKSKTDANGEYLFESLSPGSYSLVVVVSDVLSDTYTITITEGQTTTRDVVFQAT